MIIYGYNIHIYNHNRHMLRRLTQPLLRTFVTPRLGPNFMPPSSSLSTPLDQSLYQTPVPSYEKLLAGLYTPVVGQ